MITTYKTNIIESNRHFKSYKVVMDIQRWSYEGGREFIRIPFAEKLHGIHKVKIIIYVYIGAVESYWLLHVFISVYFESP